MILNNNKYMRIKYSIKESGIHMNKLFFIFRENCLFNLYSYYLLNTMLYFNVSTIRFERQLKEIRRKYYID